MPNVRDTFRSPAACAASAALVAALSLAACSSAPGQTQGADAQAAGTPQTQTHTGGAAQASVTAGSTATVGHNGDTLVSPACTGACT